VLWPNEFVKPRLKLKTLPNALVAPAAVVQHGPQGTFAYVVGPDGTAAMKPIGVESMQGDLAILSHGLQVGDEVVVEGQAQLRPGAKVSTKPAPEGGGSTDGGAPRASASASSRGSEARP
jgi:multidrug efflux system membrane fusion protein